MEGSELHPRGPTWTILPAWLFLLMVVIFLLCYYSYGTSRLPPGPRGWPLVGYLYYMGSAPHVTMTTLSRSHGDIFSIRLGSRDTLVINGNDVIGKVLAKNGELFADRPCFEAFRHYAGGTSISFSPYSSDLRLHRRLATTALRHLVEGKLMSLDNIIQREVSNLVHKWQRKTNDFDPSADVGLMVASVLYSFCFGESLKLQDNVAFSQLLTSINPTTDLFSVSSLVDIMPWLRCLTKRNKMANAVARMKMLVSLNSRQVALRSDTDRSSCIIDSVLNLWKNHSCEPDKVSLLSQQRVENTTTEFLSAGTDTSTASLLWLLLYVGRHTDIQRKIQAELSDVVGARHIRVKDQQNLPYTQACVIEIMRLATVVPFGLPHSTTKDVIINDYVIPRGTLVLVNLWSASYDERVWDAPKEFRPERFVTISSDGSMGLNRGMARSVFPFGVGRRVCVGETLGRIQMFMLFCSLLQNFDIELADEAPVDYSRAIFGDVMRPAKFYIRATKHERI